MGVEQVRIPYDGTTIGAYLFCPDASGTPRPTILSPCGYDSRAESGWLSVRAAVARGYNVLTFDGPGQGEMLFTQRIFLRPDFEHVVSQVIDWLVQRPDMNVAQLVLIGRSFAGYLAPRAACFEHRLAALVCDPAQPDMGLRVPRGLARYAALPVLGVQMTLSEDRAEFFRARMAAHGVRRVGRYLTELRRFKMLDHARDIRCPTLIVESGHDFAGGGGRLLFDALRSSKRPVRLTAADGADGHCAGLGQQTWNRVVYDWLARLFASQS